MNSTTDNRPAKGRSVIGGNCHSGQSQSDRDDGGQEGGPCIEKKITPDKKPLLEVDGIHIVDQDKKLALDDVSFTLNGGEILGVAGVAGSGQKELCETIAGLIHADKGRIYFEGDNIVGKTPRDIIRLGIRMGFIPEDRLGMGLVGTMDIVHNIVLKDYQNQPGIFLKRAECTEKANKK
jgi:simple sugar transport system ATP-binding protein